MDDRAKKLRDIKDFLKELKDVRRELHGRGFTDERIAIWIKENKNYLGLEGERTGYSQSSLSYLFRIDLTALKENKGKYPVGVAHNKLRKAVICFKKMLQRVQESPTTSSIRNETIERRSHSNTTKFLKDELSRYRERNCMVNIDAMGLKLSSLKEVIGELILHQKLPVLNMRVLLLSPNSLGSKVRGILEEKDMETTCKKALEEMKEREEMIVNYSNESIMKIRKYIFNPPTYMIRVNKAMLVSTYLGGKNEITGTYQGKSEILLKSKAPIEFDTYLRFFDKVFRNEELSFPVV